MNNNQTKCPVCGEVHDRANLIICPACGADMYPFDIYDSNTDEYNNQSNFEAKKTALPQKYNIFTAYISMFRRFRDFRGRSSRSEYWYAYLANFIITLVVVGALMAIDHFAVKNAVGDDIGKGYITAFNLVNTLFSLYSIIVFIPQLSLIVRRLHDSGKNGLYASFLFFVPAGTLAVMFLLILPGNVGFNKYGPAPGGFANP